MAARDITADTAVMLFTGRVMTVPEMEELHRRNWREIVEEKGLSPSSHEFTSTWMYR